MEYYEKTPLDHQAVLIDAESVNSVIHHLGQLNFTRRGVEDRKKSSPFT